MFTAECYHVFIASNNCPSMSSRGKYTTHRLFGESILQGELLHLSIKQCLKNEKLDQYYTHTIAILHAAAKFNSKLNIVLFHLQIYANYYKFRIKTVHFFL